MTRSSMIVARWPIAMLIGLCLFAATGFARAAVDIRDVVSPGGITAWMVEDHSIPIVSIRFSFKSGAVQDPPQKAGLANLMTGLFDEGAGALDSEAFQKRLEALGAEMSFDAGHDTISGQIRMLSENRDAVLELLALAINEPRFDPVPVERIRSQIAVQIRADERDPRNQGSRRLQEALYPGHPYARPVEGTLESLARITTDDLKTFHRRVFARSNLVIGVVGAIDSKTLGAALDSVFAPLPEEADLRDVPIVTPQLDQEVTVAYPLPQTTLQLIFPGIARDDPDFFAAYLMNHILGGGTFSSRLFDEVREKRGLAYGAGSWLSSRDHAQTLAIQTATRADQADEALSVIDDVVVAMREEGPTEKELEAAKTYIIGAYPINNLDSSTAIARTLVGLQQDNLGIDYIEKRTALINAVTLDQVRAAAQRLLATEPALMRIGPGPGPDSDG